MTMPEKKKPGRPRAEVQKPMLPAKIVQAYAETASLEKTAARVGVSPNTVRAILERNPEDFATVKKALGTRMLAVVDSAVDIAGERLGECSAPQAAVVAGIFCQRGTELLEGQSEGVTINVRALQQSAEISRSLQAELEQIRAEIARRKQLTLEQTATNGTSDSSVR